MYVTLKNGDTLACTGAYANPVTYQGVSRDCITFVFDPETIGADELLVKFTPENCASITLVDDNDDEFIHENYTIRIGAGVSCRDIALRNMGGTSIQETAPAAWVSMAQSTLAERRIEQQQEVLDFLVMSALTSDGGETHV